MGVEGHSKHQRLHAYAVGQVGFAGHNKHERLHAYAEGKLGVEGHGKHHSACMRWAMWELRAAASASACLHMRGVGREG